LTNIATLDAIATHFTRLIELTSADEPFVSALAHSLTNCILRPRIESSLTQHERHSYRLIRDLFAFKDQIFGELKRASSMTGRPRAVSTDESQRRAHVEERNRAVIGAAKSRSSSPAARHQRNASGDTRFPINMSPTSEGRRGSAVGRFKQRDSLEVPGAPGSVPEPRIDATVDNTHEPEDISASEPSYSATIATPTTNANTNIAPLVAERLEGLEKRNSLSRSSPVTVGRFPRRNANLVRSVATPKSLEPPGDMESSDMLHEQGVSPRSEGVTLSDRPMDLE
jgi:hypothetical protein